MELTLPDQLALNETSKALLADVDETARRVNEFRPLPDPVVKRVQDELLGERVYGSNAVEGNTLDYRETVTVLRTGQLIEGRKREATEARNLGKAVNQISEAVKLNAEAHKLDRLCSVHKTILKDLNDVWAGRFREQQVMIAGARYQPPDHSIVGALVERVLERLKSDYETHELVLAVWAHWALARIHPFIDGNGRIARLWQDLVLFQRGLTCAIIRPEQRREYLDALADADEGDFNKIVQLVAQQILGTFDRYLKEITEDEQLQKFVSEVAGEADESIKERQQLVYQRWSRKMEQLRWEFELCASRITEASGQLRIQINKFDLIEMDAWKNLRNGARVAKTGFFSINFDSGDYQARYVFYFAKHFWNDKLDGPDVRSENRVSLFVSEYVAQEKSYVRLDQISDCPLSIREILFVDDKFLVRQHDTKLGESRYDDSFSATRIAQEFIREVIQHRLT